MCLVHQQLLRLGMSVAVERTLHLNLPTICCLNCPIVKRLTVCLRELHCLRVSCRKVLWRWAEDIRLRSETDAGGRPCFHKSSLVGFASVKTFSSHATSTRLHNGSFFDAPGLYAIYLHVLLSNLLLGHEFLPKASGTSFVGPVESKRVLSIDFRMDYITRLLKVVSNRQIAERSLKTVVVNSSDKMRVIRGVASR